MQRAAQGWLVYKLTDRPIYLGLVAACGTLPMLLFSLPAGVVADRFSKRNILLLTQSLAMAQAFCLAALIHTDAIRVWHIMLFAALLGTVWAFDMPTRHAMVLELVDREDALNAVALNSSAFNTGRIIGPAVAGVLMAVLGLAVCFLVNGLTFVALILALATIAPRRPASSAQGALLREIGAGLAWARRSRVALALLFLITVASLYGHSYIVLLPVFARDAFRGGPLELGLMMASHGAGALFAAVFITGLGHRWRLGALATMGSFLFPAALALLALAPQYAVAIIALLLTGAGMMAFSVVANTMLQKASPDELRGRVMSLRSFLFAGMSWLGDLQMGALAEWFGPQVAVGVGAAACLIAAAGASSLVPELRRAG